MKSPKVSIITVCKNSEKTIQRTIDSVLLQSYKNIEYIIVDGISTDDTVNIIKKYEALFSGRMFWFSEKDSGIYDAMNKGISHATGEIIGIINSDDWYEVHTVETIVNEYKINRNCVFYGFLRVTEGGIEKNILNIEHRNLPKTMIPHPTCFIPIMIYKEFGKYDTKYKYAGDLELMIRFQKNNVQFLQIEKVLANYNVGGATDRYFYRSTREFYRILHRYKYISILSMYLHLLNEKRKELFQR